MPQFMKPGSVVGIIGGGVLAYRLAEKARKLDMHTVVLAPEPDDIAFEVADMRLVGNADDQKDLQRLADVSAVITFTDENVPGDLLKTLARPEQLPSGTDIFAVTQDRYLEKIFLEDQTINILPYASVVTAADIDAAVETVGFPAILKPIQKGVGVDQQLLLEQPADVTRARQLLQERPYLLEAWLEAPQEFAVLVAKADSDIQVMPVVETVFSHHALMSSVVPATGETTVTQEIQRIARILAEKIAYNGVFGVELFLTANQALYVKRLFPGPQMNGHVLAHTTGWSPYEAHLRAILGWPLPTVQAHQAGAVLFLRSEDRDAALTQAQIKPDWQFRFYPNGGELIGEIAVTGTLEAITQAVNATDYFHIGAH